MEYGNQTKSYQSRLLRNALNSFKACGYEAITVDSTIKYLTPPSDARYALISVESNGAGVTARYLEWGGIAVSSSIGIGLRDGTVFDVTDTQNLFTFQVIDVTGDTTVLHIQYYK